MEVNGYDRFSQWEPRILDREEGIALQDKLPKGSLSFREIERALHWQSGLHEIPSLGLKINATAIRLFGGGRAEREQVIEAIRGQSEQPLIDRWLSLFEGLEEERFEGGQIEGLQRPAICIDVRGTDFEALLVEYRDAIDEPDGPEDLFGTIPIALFAETERGQIDLSSPDRDAYSPGKRFQKKGGN